MSSLRAEVAEVFLPLLQPKRYKGARGGRGGAKSHFFAEQVVLQSYADTRRIVCLREVQNSIKESVHQLLQDKISKFDLDHEFDVLRDEIRCRRNGSLITFKGMQSYNAENIKSLEGYDIAWFEEAQTASAKSLRLLRPTIRKEGSELWFSWNTRYDTDPVDMFFFGEEPHPDSVSVVVNWPDNPWFPDVLKDEMEHDRNVDPEMATHVWDGGYEIIGEGAYYAKWMAAAENEGRLTNVPVNLEFPVHTAWDLGVGDDNPIWFFQVAGKEFHIVNFYTNAGYGIDHYAELVKEYAKQGGYKPGRDYVPHDAKQRSYTNSDIDGKAKQRLEVMRENGLRPRLVPIHRVDDGISAVRQILPNCWFDREKTRYGVRALRRYKRKFSEQLQIFMDVPEHGWESHPSDAFRIMAMGIRDEPKEEKPEKPKHTFMGGEDGSIKSTITFNELRERNARLRKRHG